MQMTTLSISRKDLIWLIQDLGWWWRSQCEPQWHGDKYPSLDPMHSTPKYPFNVFSSLSLNIFFCLYKCNSFLIHLIPFFKTSPDLISSFLFLKIFLALRIEFRVLVASYILDHFYCFHILRQSLAKLLNGPDWVPIWNSLTSESMLQGLQACAMMLCWFITFQWFVFYITFRYLNIVYKARPIFPVSSHPTSHCPFVMVYI